MVDLGVWQRTIVDSFGRRVAFAEISVTDSLTGQPAELFADVGGTVPLSNPFDANAEGFARFFTFAGYYDVTVSGTGSAQTWVREPLGVPDRPLVRAPEIVSPTEGQTQVNLNFELIGNAFAPLYSQDERAYRQFQAIVAGGSFDAPDFNVLENADSAIIGQVPPNTQIQARMRDVSTRGDESRWSEVVTFTSTDQFVEKPINVSPADGEVDQFPEPTLTASAFETAGIADTHVSSTFRVYETATATLVYTGEQTTGDLTQHTLTTALDINAEFEWEVVYVGETLGPSEPSERTAFATQTALPVAVNSAPSAGAVDVYPGVTLSIAPIATGWNHESTQWRVLRVSDGAVIHDSGVSTSALTSYTLPNDIFEPETQYEWQAQITIAGFDASEWSTATAYTTVAAPIPVLLAPLDGETGLGATPTLEIAPIASPFTQAGSRWRVYRDSDGVLVHDSGAVSALTSYTLPNGVVEKGETYDWEALAETEEYGFGPASGRWSFVANGIFPPSQIVSGTPSLPGTGYGVYADDTYVYLAHSGAPYFTVVNKSDWSVVSGTPSLPGTGNGVYADDTYVYLAHTDGNRFTVAQKSDWSVVSGTPSLPSNGNGVFADDTYVYLAHQGGNNFTVVNKSDWSVVSGTPSLPGAGRGVFADDTYVYLAHSGGNNFTVVNKSDWSVVSGTPSLPSTGNGVFADDTYVYLAHTFGNGFTVVQKSDWSVVSGTPDLDSQGLGVYADSDYVYLAHTGGNYFTVVNKSDWSVVSGTPSLPGAGRGVFADDTYVYLAHSGGNNFTLME